MIAEQLRFHADFPSAFLNQSRHVTVYLPPGYAHEELRRYPVLYMHDGQNLFDPERAFGGVPWRVDEIAQNLIMTEQIAPLIIVGVDNAGGERINEYTPVKGSRGHGGKADAYGSFLVGELKPFIDREYRTLPEREYTGIGGSSLGGLVSLYLAFKNPTTFSRVAALSPSVWWSRNHMLREIAKIPERVPLRIWLDIGRKEGIQIKHQVRATKEMLLAQGWQLGLDLSYVEVPNARHEEAAWSARFDTVLKFLFPAMHQ